MRNVIGIWRREEGDEEDDQDGQAAVLLLPGLFNNPHIILLPPKIGSLQYGFPGAGAN